VPVGTGAGAFYLNWGSHLTRFVMPGLMALALILIVLNYAFDYLRSTDEPVINVPGLTTPVSPRASLGFRLGAQPAAVYRVQFLTAELGDGGGGTAFLIDANCGIFATNMHVAEELLNDGIVGELQQPMTAAAISITGIKPHPARAPLLELYDTYGPVGTEPGAGGGSFVPRDPLDAALLTTGTGGLDACKPPPGVKFPEPIALAPLVSGQSLGAGTPAAIIHYPGSGTKSSSYPSLEATARVEFGTVRALGSSIPVPLAERAATPLFEDYVFLSAQVIGGSSGGVVLGPTGAAVGLIEAGSSSGDSTLRYQEAISIQSRIIAEIRDPNPDALVARYLEQAKLRLKTYLASPDYQTQQVRAAIDANSSMLGVSPTIGQPVSDMIVQKGLSNSFCAGGTMCIVPSDLGSPFTKGWFTRVNVTLDSSKINYVSASDFDLASAPSAAEEALISEKGFVTQTGFCPIAMATLKPQAAEDGGGMAVDRFERHSALPSMLFPATFKGQQSVDLLIFRPSFCSDKFLKAHVVTVPFTLETRAPAQTSALETVLRAANRALVSFGEAAAPPLWRED
jgi:hypothetical protein